MVEKLLFIIGPFVRSFGYRLGIRETAAGLHGNENGKNVGHMKRKRGAMSVVHNLKKAADYRYGRTFFAF